MVQTAAQFFSSSSGFLPSPLASANRVTYLTALPPLEGGWGRGRMAWAGECAMVGRRPMSGHADEA